METITARNNEKIKYAVGLRREARLRKESGEFFLEGARLCYDAAISGIQITRAFFTPPALEKYGEYIEAVKKVCPECYETSEQAAEKLGETENAQGVFCICKAPPSAEKELIPGGRYLALENIQDPANLGAICRTAEALALDGLIISGGCDIYNPKALRAAMGSSLRMNFITAGDLPAFLAKAGKEGFLTLASVPDSRAVSIKDAALEGGVICCIGNEGAGLTPETQAACKIRVTIPMGGRAESFNASAAAAILAWELKR